MRKNEENMEANQKCRYASQAAEQWLGLRLRFIGVAMATAIGVIAVLQHQYDVADPGICANMLGYICINLQCWYIHAVFILSPKNH
jgi:ATP-binding cassette subfamily C (CFTR/MRP) protein 10